MENVSTTLSTSYASLDFLKRVFGDQPLVGLSLCGILLHFFQLSFTKKYLGVVIEHEFFRRA